MEVLRKAFADLYGLVWLALSSAVDPAVLAVCASHPHAVHLHHAADHDPGLVVAAALAALEREATHPLARERSVQYRIA